GVVGGGADDPLAPQGEVPLGAVSLQLLAAGHPGGDLVDDAVGSAAHHRVHFGHLGADLTAVALGQAAGDHHLQGGVLLLVAAGLQNVLDGLGLGALDKAAGVHQHHVGVGDVGHRLVAGSQQGVDHPVQVHLVFGTAQRYTGNLHVSLV